MVSDFTSRILVLDGAMGTMLQKYSLLEGEQAPETLCLSKPEAIERIHRDYIGAGADIIETNSFGGNRISLSSYGLSDKAYELSRAAALIARRAAKGTGVLVAGSVGPLGYSLTLPSRSEDPAWRQYSFSQVKASYSEQIRALIDGGVDLLLFETWYDALNAKAAISALEETGSTLPLIISVSVSDLCGRTLTGQTLEAFFTSIKHSRNLAAFGLNCSRGASQLTGLLGEVASFSPLPTIFYPNAGIPDENGMYTDSAQKMASELASAARQGLVNIAGGCCGTTPEHIRAIKAALEGILPREISPKKDSGAVTFSGLSTSTVDNSLNVTNIGERTNVAGSRKFLRLINERNFEEALSVASAQIEAGAGIIDINMDDPLLDSREVMQTFLRHICADPSVAKAAVMLDSSDWRTIETALENVQGRSIVNSISLGNGEEEFLRRARHIDRMGAAMVVMAFDENGQATTLERKIAICSRSYSLLTGIGIDPHNIIFDVNVLTIGTGIPEHRKFAVDFIEAVRWIKSNLPGALTIGGISNLSFSFRGNNAVREALHSVFLYHAAKAGLDMAIVNPQMLEIYDQIVPQLRQAAEDLIFDRGEDAVGRLIRISSESAAENIENKTVISDNSSFTERLALSLIKGDMSQLSALVEGSLTECGGNPLDVVGGALLGGMETVGKNFADGKMFLPQVVRSARVMSGAVAILEPLIKEKKTSESSSRPRFVLATVKGDVHDIGKNITGILLSCSGFDVIDLGVMVPCEEILSKANELGASFIGVSGLISPSLRRMEELALEMERRGMDIPLFVGGAAVTEKYTAKRLACLYSNVHYGADASATALKARKYLTSREEFLSEEAARLDKIRKIYPDNPPVREDGTSEKGQENTKIPVHAPVIRDLDVKVTKALRIEAPDIAHSTLPSDEFIEFFDWKMFYGLCGLNQNKNSTSLEKEREDARKSALKVLSESSVELELRLFNVSRDGDELVCDDFRFPLLRSESGESLADLFSDKEATLGLYAACVRHHAARCGCCIGQGYGDVDLVAHSALVTLADAASSYMAGKIGGNVTALLVGCGYPSLPDHSLKRDILSRLKVGITLSESCAMTPQASICGLAIFLNEGSYDVLPQVRSISPSQAAAYAAARGFDKEKAKLFVGGLVR